MKLAYIAGRYSGLTEEEIQANIRAAERVAMAMARRGYFPVCPHKNSENFHTLLPEVPVEFWYEGDLRLLRICDVMVLVPGWECSTGVQREIEEARRLGIPCIEFAILPEILT